MQLDIFFTYYLKTHRIVLAQNVWKKKNAPVPMDPMMMMGNGRFFPIFFWHQWAIIYVTTEMDPMGMEHHLV